MSSISGNILNITLIYKDENYKGLETWNNITVFQQAFVLVILQQGTIWDLTWLCPSSQKSKITAICEFFYYFCDEYKALI